MKCAETVIVESNRNVIALNDDIEHIYSGNKDSIMQKSKKIT